MKANYKLWFETDEKFFGEGPCRLLHGVERCGSLSEAAAEMNLSYKKALKLITRAEQQLGVKLIARTIGGATGGGSVLTKDGSQWLYSYENLRQQIDHYVAHHWHSLAKQRLSDHLLQPIARQLAKSPALLVSIVGGGGKTTLQNLLWDAFSDSVATLYTTTTHMQLRPDIETYFKEGPPGKSIALFAEQLTADKVKGLTSSTLDELYLARTYPLILCEADGSRNKPFKVYRRHEPPLADCTTDAYIVLGCDAFYLPAGAAVHGYQLLNSVEDQPITLAQALDYLMQTTLKKIPAEARVTLIFNKYSHYGLPENMMTIANYLRSAARPLKLLTTELAEGICFHAIEVNGD